MCRAVFNIINSYIIDTSYLRTRAGDEFSFGREAGQKDMNSTLF
jgi:hypothetical protein